MFLNFLIFSLKLFTSQDGDAGNFERWNKNVQKTPEISTFTVSFIPEPLG